MSKAHLKEIIIYLSFIFLSVITSVLCFFIIREITYLNSIYIDTFIAFISAIIFSFIISNSKSFYIIMNIIILTILNIIAIIAFAIEKYI